MDDMMSKIGSILSDEESMTQIRQLAEMLGMGGGGMPPPPSSPPPIPSPSQSPPPMDFGGLDIGMLMQIQGLMQKASCGDKNSDLLLALRPHLCEERQLKIDKAVKMLRILAVITIVKEAGLLDKLDIF